ncbi:MAG: phosphomannomutase/phosphoglucomutase [Deltaproteobacteria bacterium]|nr:phosphomannomutase/phosphoglucomutase [Deltaproteobacteria bacterium]
MHVVDKAFREYDIRGTVDKEINEHFAFVLGKIFSAYIRKKTDKREITVSVGYDARLSSRSLTQSLIKGFNTQGVKVINVGLVPTPLLYFSLFKLPVDGGIMVTASHNPPRYNGFKLCLNKTTLYGQEIQEIKELMKRDKNRYLKQITPVYKEYDIIKDYKAYILNQFGYLREYHDKPKLVLDAGNGCGGLVAYPLIKDLGFEIEGLYIEPDGNFPNHHPDPTKEENLRDMKKVVKEKNYDLGIGFDGDADRVGVVLKDGRTMLGDRLMLLFSEYILKEKVKNPIIIADVKCSDILFERVRELGGKPIMWKTGHSLIKEKLYEEDAVFAGEMSGHYFFNDRYFGYDDAIYGALRLLEIITKNNLNLSEWMDSLPRVSSTPEIRMECPEERKKEIVFKICDYFKQKGEEYKIKEIVTIDGIRFKTEDGWVLVRASNTQPELVLRFEAKDEGYLKKMLSIVQNKIGEFLKE